MVIALWALINIALLSGFLVFSYYAVKLIRIRFGYAIAIIFALGLNLANNERPSE